MKLGLDLARYTFGDGVAIGPAVAETAKRTEAAGFDSFWVMDHFFQTPSAGAITDPMLEAYTTLGFAAGVTSRIQIGTLVTGVTYRHPAILVQTATTLDVLAGGRTVFGLGAAWYEREHLGLGVPFPPLKARFDILEDTLKIAKQMWAGDTTPFTSERLSLVEPVCSPLPVSQPHPPILIGGGGEKRTLKLVAKYADIASLPAAVKTPEQIAAKLAVLAEHCDREGRDMASIEISTVRLIGRLRRNGEAGSTDPNAVIEHLAELAEAGIDHLMIILENPLDEVAWEIVVTDILPAAHRLETRRNAYL